MLRLIRSKRNRPNRRKNRKGCDYQRCAYVKDKRNGGSAAALDMRSVLCLSSRKERGQSCFLQIRFVASFYPLFGGIHRIMRTAYGIRPAGCGPKHRPAALPALANRRKTEYNSIIGAQCVSTTVAPAASRRRDAETRGNRFAPSKLTPLYSCPLHGLQNTASQFDLLIVTLRGTQGR